MNFGILMVQGLVNSFGPVIMAAFAAAVKIDSFAYMPVSGFREMPSPLLLHKISGQKKEDRIRQGIRSAFLVSFFFCLAVSLLVCIFARPLMQIFVSADETQIIEPESTIFALKGSCYFGIGYFVFNYGLWLSCTERMGSHCFSYRRIFLRRGFCDRLFGEQRIPGTDPWSFFGLLITLVLYQVRRVLDFHDCMACIPEA